MQKDNHPHGIEAVEYESPLICIKCSADKVADSRTSRLEDLYMRFVPRVAYRCMRCYYRFWKSEGLFENSKRSWTLSLTLVATVLISIYALQTGLRSGDDHTSPSNELAAAEPSATGALAEGSIESSSERTFEDPLRVAARQAAIDDLQALASVQVFSADAATTEEFAQTQDSIAPGRAELESLAKVEVSYLIEQWRNAWQAGVSDIYLSYYSERFAPSSGQNLRQWQQQRRLRVVPSKNIELALDDFSVSFDTNIENSTVTFGQLYRSGEYSELSRKQLVLSKEQEAWKIVSETEIN